MTPEISTTAELELVVIGLAGFIGFLLFPSFIISFHWFSAWVAKRYRGKAHILRKQRLRLLLCFVLLSLLVLFSSAWWHAVQSWSKLRVSQSITSSTLLGLFGGLCTWFLYHVGTRKLIDHIRP